MLKAKTQNRIRRSIAMLLCVGLLGGTLTACGEAKKAAAPELLEPAGITESYRPVKRRDIGDTSMLEGIVVAESYPVFAEKPFEIYQLNVTPGDYVEAGDVIATGDTRDLDTGISNLNRELESLSLERSAGQTISAKTVEMLTWQKKAAEEAGFSGDAYDTEIRIEKENLRYEQESIDASIRAVKKELSKLQEDKGKRVYRAPHSGYVTFLKDISATNSVQQSENIAVISDYNDLYIEVAKPTNAYKFANYQEKYILVEGKKHTVQEYEYTTKEMSYAETMSAYPYVRFRVEGVPMEIGATMPIYFAKKSSTDVISVENDSIYREGEIYYCYVKNQDGEQERRNLEVGAVDSLYTEVISGLEEGDLVFYDNKSVLPVKYTEYEVKAKDYIEEFYAEAISMLLTEHDLYLSDYSGSLTSSKVSMGDQVEKGQELLEIEIPRGKGELAEQKNRITDTEQSHSNRMKQLDQQIADTKARMEAAANQPAPTTRKKETNEETTKEPEAGTTNAPEAGTSNASQNQDSEAPGEDETNEPGEKDTDAPDNTPDNTPGRVETDAPGGVDTDVPGEDDTENDVQDEEDDTPSDEEREALRASLYVKEICSAELEILAQQKKLEEYSYNYTIRQLKDQLAEMNVGASTNGKVTVTARAEGTLGQIGLQENTSLYKGEYLFTVNREGEKLLRISMPKARGQVSQTAAKPGQKIELRTDDKVYTGTCIAVNGNQDKNYLFTRDGKEHLTHSQPYTAGQTEQFFVRMDDDSYYTDGMPSAVASFQGRFIRSGITVPSRAVYSEKDTKTDEMINFVWKVTEGGLVKQTVTVYESNLPGDEKMILSGVEIGDKVVVE